MPEKVSQALRVIQVRASADALAVPVAEALTSVSKSALQAVLNRENPLKGQFEDVQQSTWRIGGAPDPPIHGARMRAPPQTLRPGFPPPTPAG